MYQIFIGSLVLSLIHALIPNHWIPLIAISKTEKWTQRQTMLATAITGFAHTFSTILVGMAVGLIGFRLSSSYSVVSTLAAPLVLTGLGIVFIIIDLRGMRHHHHPDQTSSPVSGTGKSKWRAVIISLSVAMFFTPCIEIEAYYFQAGSIGWPGILIVSAVYLLMTIMVMLILVYLGFNGMKTFNSNFLEHHEKGITGVVLVALGLLAFFVKF